jgi:hypothetical protein
MRFEVLTALKMSVLVFWVMTPCGLVSGYPHSASLFRAEEGGSM